MISGSYDKNGLPEDWPDFMEDILDCMLFYGFGEIVDPAVYNKAKRRKHAYIFCSVLFDTGHKVYYYLTDDDSLKEGDFVIVPVGDGENTAIVKIVRLSTFLKKILHSLSIKSKKISKHQEDNVE